MVSRDQAQHGVTEQLKALVGGQTTPFRTVGAVRERLIEQLGADRVVGKYLAQPLAVSEGRGGRIAQAAPTFPLT